MPACLKPRHPDVVLPSKSSRHPAARSAPVSVLGSEGTSGPLG